MTRQLLRAACSAVLILGTAGAGAQSLPSTPRAWESVVVPGGFAAFQHAIPTGGTADDSRAIPLAIELSFAGLDGMRVSRNIAQYAALLRRLRHHRDALSSDRTITLASREQRRERFDELLQVLGLEYDRNERKVRAGDDRAAAERARQLELAGLPLVDIADRLNAGASVTLVTRDAVAPLPLGAAFWRDRFDPAPPPDDLLFAILSSREMSSLYYALLGFDDATLEAARAEAALSSALIRHALVLPIVVPALRIRDGRVVPPGPPNAAPLWEDLVGKRLDRPGDFVNSLLAADQGRLAYFYRTASVVPHAALSTSKDGMRRLYSTFAGTLDGWQPNAMVQPPFPGPADVLIDLAVQADGAIAGPPWRDFWRRALESDEWPSDSAREVARVDRTRRLNSADLLELLCPQACDTRKMAAFALLQREFPQPSPEMMPALLGIVRARLRYPSLALAIGRMKLGDPAVYSELGSVAARVETLSQPSQAIAIVQLQSALELLARLRAVGAPAAIIRERAGALAALPVNRDGFDGGLVRWLGQVFPAAADESVDDVAVRSLAGAAWQTPGPSVEWEGSKYRVDIAATEEARIHAVREKFSANALSTAARLVRIADGAPDALAANAADATIAALAETMSAAIDLGAVSWPGTPTSIDSFGPLATEVVNDLRRARASDRGRIERAVQPLRRAADAIAADALAALVYSLAIQDPENPFVMSRELPRRHHLQPEGIGGNRVSPWELAGERTPERAMRYISGSLLALSAGVPQLAVRRMVAARPTEEPNMALVVAAELQRTAALATPWSVDDEDLGRIESARARGAAMVQAIADTASLDRVMARAGIAGPRAGWLRWTMANGRTVSDMMTNEDLVRAGGIELRSSSWGVTAAVGTCICLTVPSLSWEMRGMPRQPDQAAITIVEPALRTALEIRQRRLPSALAPGVLALVVTDIIERSALPHHSDVPAIGAAVRRVSSTVFDDYVAAVAARGPLVPVSDEPRAAR
jgi:hypothetical protein